MHSKLFKKEVNFVFILECHQEETINLKLWIRTLIQETYIRKKAEIGKSQTAYHSSYPSNDPKTAQ